MKYLYLVAKSYMGKRNEILQWRLVALQLWFIATKSVGKGQQLVPFSCAFGGLIFRQVVLLSYTLMNSAGNIQNKIVATIFLYSCIS